MIASIITFNPEIDRLKENIQQLCNQVDRVVIVDNNSKNRDFIIELCSELNKDIKIISNKENLGIAKALNQAAYYALSKGETWLLTMDQDSIINTGLIEEYTCFVQKHSEMKIGMLACLIKDRSFAYETSQSEDEYIDVETCITSGSLLNLLAWREVLGFDEKMFIDKVDSDMCLSLKRQDYRILKINFVGILHEIGNNTTTKKILGKRIIIFNHSAFRCYYIIRNQVYYFRKHRHYLSHPYKTYFAAYNRLIIILLFEKNKFSKIKRGLQGLVDGHKMSLQKSQSEDKEN